MYAQYIKYGTLNPLNETVSTTVSPADEYYGGQKMRISEL
jgi:hypothetical protein